MPQTEPSGVEILHAFLSCLLCEFIVANHDASWSASTFATSMVDSLKPTFDQCIQRCSTAGISTDVEGYLRRRASKILADVRAAVPLKSLPQYLASSRQLFASKHPLRQFSSMDSLVDQFVTFSKEVDRKQYVLAASKTHLTQLENKARAQQPTTSTRLRLLTQQQLQQQVQQLEQSVTQIQADRDAMVVADAAKDAEIEKLKQANTEKDAVIAELRQQLQASADRLVSAQQQFIAEHQSLQQNQHHLVSSINHITAASSLAAIGNHQRVNAVQQLAVLQSVQTVQVQQAAVHALAVTASVSKAASSSSSAPLGRLIVHTVRSICVYCHSNAFELTLSFFIRLSDFVMGTSCRASGSGEAWSTNSWYILTSLRADFHVTIFSPFHAFSMLVFPAETIYSLSLEQKIGWVIAHLISVGLSIQGFLKALHSSLSLAFADASRPVLIPSATTLQRWQRTLYEMLCRRRREVLSAVTSVSLMFDGSKRHGVERVAVFVGYPQSGNSSVDMLDFLSTLASTGEQIARLIINCLHRFNLNPQCELLLCTDSCSVMIGAFKSVFAWIPKLWPGMVYHFSCLLHQGSLATKSAVERSVGVAGGVLTCHVLNVGYSVGWMQEKYPKYFGGLWSLWVWVLKGIQQGEKCFDSNIYSSLRNDCYLLVDSVQVVEIESSICLPTCFRLLASPACFLSSPLATRFDLLLNIRQAPSLCTHPRLHLHQLPTPF